MCKYFGSTSWNSSFDSLCAYKRSSIKPNSLEKINESQKIAFFGNVSD